MRTVRLLAIGLRFHVKSLTLSLFFLLTSVFMPLLVATVSYYMFRAGGRPGTLFYASLGAAVYGIWSSTLFGSGGAIQWQRWQGTLEVLVSAPTPFILVILPLTVATSTIGVYSLTSTLSLGAVRVRDPVPRSSIRSRSSSRCRRRSSASACSACSSRPRSSSTATRTRSRTCSSGRCCSSPGCSCRSRSCPAGRTRSRGCSRRPGGCAGSAGRARRHALARHRDDRSRSALAYLALGARVPPLLRDRRPQAGDALADVRSDRLPADLLHRRRDRLPRPLQLDQALDVHPDDADRAGLPDPLLRLPRPVQRAEERRLLRRRQRGAGLGDVGGLRGDDDDRQRAPLPDALAAPRHARRTASPSSWAARCRCSRAGWSSRPGGS